MALEYLVSMEGDGERVRGSVVNKVGSEVSRHTLQESSSEEETRLLTSR